MMKRCSTCKEFKELSEFNKNRAAKDGLYHKCRACAKLYSQRPDQRQRRNEYNKIYDKTEAGRQCHKKYEAKDSAKRHRQEYLAAYNQREEVKQRKRDYARGPKGRLNAKKRSEKYYQTEKGRETRRIYDKKRAKTPTRRKAINKRIQERRLEDPLFRLSSNLRSRLRIAVKRNHLTKDSSFGKCLGCSVAELRAYLEALFQPLMSWDNYGFGMDKWNIDHKIPLSSAKTMEELYKLCYYTNLQPLWQPLNIKKGGKIRTPNLNSSVTI